MKLAELLTSSRKQQLMDWLTIFPVQSMMSHDVLLIRTVIQGPKPSLKVTSWNELAKIRRASTPPNKNEHDSRNTTVWVDVSAIGQIMGEKNRPESYRKVFRGYNRCKSNLQVQHPTYRCKWFEWQTLIIDWLSHDGSMRRTVFFYLHEWVWFLNGTNVGKYASPMDPMGMIFACVCFKHFHVTIGDDIDEYMWCPKCFFGVLTRSLLISWNHSSNSFHVHRLFLGTLNS